jgi:hypothetical protein
MVNRQDPAEVPLCDACRRVPVSHLALDVDEPVSGWPVLFAERGIEVTNDHLGRPSVPRYVLGDLIDEQKKREARQAERPRPDRTPVPGGIPAAREDASALETLMSGPGYTTVREEFGRPPPRFLEEQLAAGQQQAAAKRAEQQAVKKAQRALDERGDKEG